MSRLRCKTFDDPLEFHRKTGSHLLEHEAHHCVMLGLLERFTNPKSRRAGEATPLMVAIEEDDARIVAAATCTRPYPIVVSHSPAHAASELADYLAKRGTDLCGVTGPIHSAQAFAQAWSAPRPCSLRVDTELGVYQIEAVTSTILQSGMLRAAQAGDFQPLTPWAQMFYRQINEQRSDAVAQLKLAIDEKRLFVWCDGGHLLSMAAWAGPTPNGIRVNFVFTPEHLRGRGYASSCVTALTRMLLEGGRRFVFLFTDMSNPVSNRLYQRIGYRCIGQQQRILFETIASG